MGWHWLPRQRSQNFLLVCEALELVPLPRTPCAVSLGPLLQAGCSNAPHSRSAVAIALRTRPIGPTSAPIASAEHDASCPPVSVATAARSAILRTGDATGSRSRRLRPGITLPVAGALGRGSDAEPLQVDEGGCLQQLLRRHGQRAAGRV